jgi:energy-converting hydrogenase Eha subunit H
MTPFVRLETVHLDEQLVQGLFALVVTAAEAGAAMTADRVDFVDEDDAGRVLLALLEQVAHA